MVVILRDAGMVLTHFEPEDKQPWMKDAACLYADPEVFFDRPNADDAPGKKYCARCDVVNDCLIWALLTENPVDTRYGYLGGTGPAERTNIYKAIKGEQK